MMNNFSELIKKYKDYEKTIKRSEKAKEKANERYQNTIALAEAKRTEEIKAADELLKPYEDYLKIFKELKKVSFNFQEKNKRNNEATVKNIDDNSRELADDEIHNRTLF